MNDHKALQTDNMTYPPGYFDEPMDEGEQPLFYCERCGCAVYDGETYWRHSRTGEEICDSCILDEPDNRDDWTEEMG